MQSKYRISFETDNEKLYNKLLARRNKEKKTITKIMIAALEAYLNGEQNNA